MIVLSAKESLDFSCHYYGVPSELRAIIRSFYSFPNPQLDDSKIRTFVDLWCDPSTRIYTWLSHGHISEWDISAVTSMRSLFANQSNFNDNIGTWKVSQVIDMSEMFYNCFSFNQSLSQWETRRVTNMSSMFEGASQFNQPLNTFQVKRVINLSRMFARAYAFNQPLDMWQVKKVSDMESMFECATSFNQPLNSWQFKGVMNMRRMFARANVFNQPLDTWDLNPEVNIDDIIYQTWAFNQSMNMNKWGIKCLSCGNQEVHDTFIKWYLTGKEVSSAKTKSMSPLNDNIINFTELILRLRYSKYDLVDFINSKSTTGPITRVHRLALYIMLTRYGSKWLKMFDKTYSTIVSILELIKLSNSMVPLIFPPNWTKQVFQMENIILSPYELKGIIFGIDPLSSVFSSGSEYATGYAFTYDIDKKDRHRLRLASTDNLYNIYGFSREIDLMDHVSVEHNLMKAHGIALVNFIRTIPEDSISGDQNVFHDIWSGYHRELIRVVATRSPPSWSWSPVPALIFENPDCPYERYIDEYLQRILKESDVKRCTDPSYIVDHRGLCWKYIDEASDNNVSKFVGFIDNVITTERRGDICCCPCKSCQILQAEAITMHIFDNEAVLFDI